MPLSELAAELAQHASRGLTRRRRTLAGPQRPRAIVDGVPVLSFCSNDYLGLAADPGLIAAAQEGVARYGVGAGASHLVLGHTTAHEALEDTLAQFVRLPRALLFSSGYLANMAMITALAGRDDAIFADKLNHASLNDAALLSRATLRRYAHADLDALEEMLKSTRARRRLIVSDAVFSMDGDLADVPRLVELSERYGAWLVLDDAHGFGVLGAGGRGTLAHFDASHERIVYMATLGKAAGVSGAFVAGAPEVIETLMQRGRAYIYTTAAPAALAHTLLASISIIGEQHWRRERLHSLIDQLGTSLTGLRWPLMRSPTPIQPLLVGDNVEAVGLAAALAHRGLMVPAIRPPTVPAGTARLRISLSAAHEPGDVTRLARALHDISGCS